MHEKKVFLGKVMCHRKNANSHLVNINDFNFKKQQEKFLEENIYSCGAMFHQLQVNTQVSISGNEKVRKGKYLR